MTLVEMYHEYGLPTPAQALENGCVARLQSCWYHAAVFLAREHTKRNVGWDCFNSGAPMERGGVPRDKAAAIRVKQRFLFEYEKMCRLVRDGEVLTCKASIGGFVPRLDAPPPMVEVVQENKVDFAEQCERWKQLQRSFETK